MQMSYSPWLHAGRLMKAVPALQVMGPFVPWWNMVKRGAKAQKQPLMVMDWFKGKSKIYRKLRKP